MHLCPLRVLGAYTLRAVNVRGSQILAFKYYSSLNEAGLLGEMTASRARAGKKKQDELGLFDHARE